MRIKIVHFVWQVEGSRRTQSTNRMQTKPISHPALLANTAWRGLVNLKAHLLYLIC